MRPTPAPKEYNIPLVPGGEASRQAALEKMRGKLAGRSQDVMAMEAGQRRRARRKSLAWGWRIALAVLFIAANAFLFAPGGKEAGPEAKVRRAPAVLAPKNLGVNDQALYWTYALYDFSKLTQRFGVKSDSVVDAVEAKSRLRELLPKVDKRTRFVIDRYLPREGNKA